MIAQHALLAAVLGSLPLAQTRPELTVLGPDPAVVKVGDSASVTIKVSDVDGGELLLPPPVPGLTIGRGQQGMSLTSINGRRSVFTSWTLHLVPSREGRFEVPPIRVTVDGTTLETPPIRLEAVKDVTGAKYAFLEMDAPQRPHYVHEPIRVKLRLGVDEKIAGNLVLPMSRRINLPLFVEASWFTDLPGAVPIEPEPNGAAAQGLVLSVNDADVRCASLGTVERDGQRFRVFEVERSFLPSRAGVLELPAALLRYQFATRFTQNLFGERMVAAAETAFVYGEPARTRILPIPDAGRPAGYTGAVGRFRVSADATPRDVKAGDVVKLTLRIEGEGNLEFLDPPRIEPLEGFHVFGKLEEKSSRARVVTWDLSPLSEAVTEIPAIPFSFFDTTEPAGFRTVATDAIPLVVRPLPPGAALAPLDGETARRAIPGVDDIHDMKPLIADAWQRPAPPGGVAAAAVLGAPLALAAGAWLLVRRRERDAAHPERVRARRAAARFQESVRRDADAASAFTGYLADRLGCAEAAVVSNDLAARLAARGIGADLASRSATALLGAIEARYAKGSATARLDSDSAARLVEELETAFAAEGSR